MSNPAAVDLAAIVLAAGLSSRMGAFKPLLELDGRTALARCVDVFRVNGIGRVLVVTGNRPDEVGAAARAAGAEPVHNPDYGQGMFSSVLAGVRGLPTGIAGFFLLPVDIPLVRPETVARLAECFRRDAPCVLYPRFMAQRGHPPVIGAGLIPEILTHDGAGGLRTVLARYDAPVADAMMDSAANAAEDMDTADFGVSHDLDHPEDYELARSLAGRGYPCDAECEQLWAMFAGADHVIAHCRAVAGVAEGLCERLNGRGASLDCGLVRAAALVHDIGKGERSHDAVGAQRLRDHGFGAAADIVAAHSDLELGPEEPLTERELVFLADKLVRRDAPVALAARYMEKVEMFRNEPGAEAAIMGRLRRAEAVLERVNREAACDAETVAREVLA